ncbi:hypothetical protein BCR33DRAFT_835921 [Rhizoclosmatium globosum]|uniref:Uncharacterized protein n=1 Tax=Rhizoclosmatium globosum TaxID=329046 RepID=A0A1Y2BN15_9FUNG|nr:hypothetical protein BCR33DRAFT_835921 [Rhizoclosmatium globosum]|eukprot:ORY36110.1 hypothetical protein BCR33DRAFT_835921 [Rhizoclosmatium globosum]
MAGANGNAEAQAILGNMYMKGKEVEVGGRRSGCSKTYCAAQIDSTAQYYLETMYRDGLGTVKDLALARELLQKSSDDDWHRHNCCSSSGFHFRKNIKLIS